MRHKEDTFLETHLTALLLNIFDHLQRPEWIAMNPDQIHQPQLLRRRRIRMHRHISHARRAGLNRQRPVQVQRPAATIRCQSRPLMASIMQFEALALASR